MTDYRQAAAALLAKYLRVWSKAIREGQICFESGDREPGSVVGEDGAKLHDKAARLIIQADADRERLEQIRDRLLDDDHPDELADDLRAILGDPHG